MVIRDIGYVAVVPAAVESVDSEAVHAAVLSKTRQDYDHFVLVALVNAI
jgi:hypothetical protein